MRSGEDFNEEIRAHLEIEADRLRAEGMSAADAEEAARRAFGNAAMARERFWESQRWMFFERLMQDLRYSVRALRQSPGFAIAAVLSLALGIGANTAIFSIVDAAILRTLPVKDPGRLFEIADDNGSLSHPEYEAYRKGNKAFSGILAAGWPEHRDVLIGDGAAERVMLNAVSGNYFDVLGIRQAAGRLFGPSDDAAGAGPTAVLSYSYWKRRFALDPSAIGGRIRIGTGIFTVVGIAGRAFFGETVGQSVDIWIPLHTHALAYPGRKWIDAKNTSWLRVIGRLTPGITPEQAAAPLTPLRRQFVLSRIGPDASAESIQSARRETIRVRPADKGLSQIGPAAVRTLWVLLAVSALVLAVACANVANLQLARTGARQREIGIRLSLGAGRSRLVRQLLTESVLLACCGGVLGIVVALLLSRALLGLASDTASPIALQTGPDLTMLSFMFAVSLACGLLSGMAPAWRGSRPDVNSTLNGNRQSSARATRSRLGPVLVGAQVAVSLAILIAAGLLIRTLENIRNIDPGLTPERLLVVDVAPKLAGYSGPAYAEVCERLAKRLASIPGVNTLTYSTDGLFIGRNSNTLIRVDNRPAGRAPHDSTYYDTIGPRYFTTLGIPLVRGRDFDGHDRAPGRSVAIVNEEFARFWLGGADPVGHRIFFDNTEFEIVGMARDVRTAGLRREFRRYFYVPYLQRTGSDPFSISFMLRTAADPARMAGLVRQAVHSEDKALPIGGIDTAEELIDRTIAQERLIATLSGWFAALALLIAAVGLCGLLGYRVARRTGEIGVRMALGARSDTVLRMVLRESLGMVTAGVAVGIPLGLAGCRELKSLLYGLSATDIPTIAMASAGMIAVGLLAAAVPARRAAGIDPIQALRYE